MDESLRQFVRRRAGERCEYCRLPEPLLPHAFTIDHVVARQHGGPTHTDNLAFVCQHCNCHKGPNIAGLDPVTRRLTRLFNPRQDRWEDHFEWAGHELAGMTDIGRTTVVVLAMNDDDMRGLRAVLMLEGLFPPLPGRS
jgi:HNH endonuclease